MGGGAGGSKGRKWARSSGYQPSRRNGAETTTSLRTDLGCLNATWRATPPPSERPMTSAFSKPRCLMSTAMVGHRLEAQRPVDVGGPPVALQVDGDDLPPAG